MREKIWVSLSISIHLILEPATKRWRFMRTCLWKHARCLKSLRTKVYTRKKIRYKRRFKKCHRSNWISSNKLLQQEKK